MEFLRRNNNPRGAGAGGAGVGEEDILKNNFGNNHILILGHGSINSNEFIILPEHINLKLYVEKGHTLISPLNKSILSRISINNSSTHFIREKTLLNNMNIKFNNTHQYKYLQYSDVINIVDTHLINYSGIINNKNIIPITSLNNQIYEQYNIKSFINEQFYFMTKEEILESYNFDTTYINEYYFDKLNKLSSNLIRLLFENNIEKDSDIFNVIINQFRLEKINKNYLKKYFDIGDEIIKELIKINNLYLHISNNYMIIQSLYHYFNLNIGYNDISYYSIDSHIYNEYPNNNHYNNYYNNNNNNINNVYKDVYMKDYIHFNNKIEKIYIFNKKENIIGYNIKNYHHIHIFNNMLKNNIQQEVKVLLLHFQKDYFIKNNVKISIGRLINEIFLPINYNEEFLNNAWSNIVNLSYHYHNNEIISKEEIIENSFTMNLGYILHKINVYNKNIFNNQTIICHGLNCRNYTPLERNKNIKEFRRLVNEGLNEGAGAGGLVRSQSLINNVTVHRLIRQSSASNEYKELFENIIEKCKNIIKTKMNHINRLSTKSVNNISYKNVLMEENALINDIEKTYQKNHFLIRDHIKFLISILRTR